MLDKKEQQNEAWYNRRYNEDYTQSAEAQAALNKAREYANESIKRAEGTQAVMGGTDEAVANAKEAAAEAVANATTAIASQATAMKDAVDAQYRQTQDAIDNARIGIQNQQAQNSAQAGGQALQAGLNLAMADAQAHLDHGKGVFASMFAKKKGGTNG